MPKKILITSLGTGERREGYRIAKYQIDNQIYEESFIAMALDRHYCFDRIFMIGTKRSIWDGVYETFGRGTEGYDDEIQWKLLEKQSGTGVVREDLVVLEDLWYKIGKAESKAFLIDYGLNEAELWRNFEVFLEIAGKIQDEDELYLDITHSFRSLSLMSFVMLNFISSQKKRFDVRAIFYGMLEYIHDLENEEKTAPIVDLKLFYELSEWIKAITAFKTLGRADLIAEQIARKYGEKNQLNKDFSHFSKDIAISNLGAIYDFVYRVSKRLDQFGRAKSPVVRLIGKDVVDFINRMRKERLSDFQLEMAKWYGENKNYMPAYISLAESIYSKIAEMRGIENKSEGDTIKIKEILKHEFKSLDEKSRQIRKIRNLIAHQNKERKGNVFSSIQNLQKYIAGIEREFKNMDRDHEI